MFKEDIAQLLGAVDVEDAHAAGVIDGLPQALNLLSIPHAELFEEILVQPNSSEFVIAMATKDSIINLAKLDLVNDIDYWDDTIEVISEDEPDELYRNAFIEWSVSKNGKECLASGYQYKELYHHYSDNKLDWVLVSARYLLPETDVETWIYIGGRSIMSGSLCAPFKCCYGIYDVELSIPGGSIRVYKVCYIRHFSFEYVDAPYYFKNTAKIIFDFMQTICKQTIVIIHRLK